MNAFNEVVLVRSPEDDADKLRDAAHLVALAVSRVVDGITKIRALRGMTQDEVGEILAEMESEAHDGEKTERPLVWASVERAFSRANDPYTEAVELRLVDVDVLASTLVKVAEPIAASQEAEQLGDERAADLETWLAGTEQVVDVDEGRSDEPTLSVGSFWGETFDVALESFQDSGCEYGCVRYGLHSEEGAALVWRVTGLLAGGGDDLFKVTSDVGFASWDAEGVAVIRKSVIARAMGEAPVLDAWRLTAGIDR